ncbi:hypothetical protein HED54_07400 [Ochrobactrum anthropi ATCC 49188]|nr:hypothetical protein [Brucella anthropi ATCC 49188]
MHSYAYSSCLRQYLDVNLKNDEKPVAMRDGCAYRGSRLTGGLPLHQSQHSSFEAIMPFYPAETISEFAKMHSTWKDRHDDLATKIMARYYRNKRASEYARHGLSVAYNVFFIASTKHFPQYRRIAMSSLVATSLWTQRLFSIRSWSMSMAQSIILLGFGAWRAT